MQAEIYATANINKKAVLYIEASLDRDNMNNEYFVMVCISTVSKLEHFFSPAKNQSPLFTSYKNTVKPRKWRPRKWRTSLNDDFFLRIRPCKNAQMAKKPR